VDDLEFNAEKDRTSGDVRRAIINGPEAKRTRHMFHPTSHRSPARERAGQSGRADLPGQRRSLRPSIQRTGSTIHGQPFQTLSEVFRAEYTVNVPAAAF